MRVPALLRGMRAILILLLAAGLLVTVSPAASAALEPCPLLPPETPPSVQNACQAVCGVTGCPNPLVDCLLHDTLDPTACL